MGAFLEDFEKPKAVVVEAEIIETEEDVAAEFEPVSDLFDEGEPEEQVPSLKMTKAELVAAAEERGIEVVPDAMTKAEILAAIEE